MIMSELPHTPQAKPLQVFYHPALHTTFKGLAHNLSTPDYPIAQFLGIKYAEVPARFRQSRLFATYPSSVDATRHGYVVRVV